MPPHHSRFSTSPPASLHLWVGNQLPHARREENCPKAEAGSYEPPQKGEGLEGVRREGT